MADSAVPSSEEVTSYLATHKLEPAIEDAVNDAVLKQVKVRCCTERAHGGIMACAKVIIHRKSHSGLHLTHAHARVYSQAPFRHIAEILLKKSEEVGEPKAPRFSMGSGEKKAAFANGMPVPPMPANPVLREHADAA